MSLVINHNMMAANTARNLNNIYGRLSNSVERLSSGLRINSAADDAAGLAIRELMRADITTMQQGVRNAADAISMIQTADGGMAVIDEKLTRMKELAEQAATGTYTTLQREIINSEYQAMAAEIDRIASATNFNGVKLLDGSITNLHGGQGMKIHFGVGNKASEDYYFINTGDVRATSTTGLRIGGDAKNDIWGQGAAGATGLAGPGCCTAGYTSLDGRAGFTSGETFAYGYNWDWMEDDDPDLLSGKYLAGRYTVGSSWSLQDLVDEVNRGTQSRVGVKLDGQALEEAIKAGGTAAVCVGDEAYIFGSAAVAGGTVVIPAVTGQVWNYLAEGSYDTDFQYNAAAGYGFGLTQDQIQALEDAGLDLTALGLTSASVSGSADSNVSSAKARAALVTKLAQAWSDLNLGALSGLTISAAVVSGYSLTSANILASASGVITGTGMTATITNGETLVIHTGVYADADGNWTDDRRIASALGLSEVVFNVANSDAETWTTTLTSISSPYVTVCAATGVTFYVDANEAPKLTAAGVNYVNGNPAGLTGTTYTGTGATRQEASADLQAQVEAAWEAQYSSLDRLDFKVGCAGTECNLTADQFEAALIAAFGGTATGASILSDTNTTVTFSVPNVWVDTQGNYTSSQAVATALNLTQLQYTITTGASGTEKYEVKTNLADGGTFTATNPTTTTLSGLATQLAASTGGLNISDALTAHRATSSASNEGKIRFQPPSEGHKIPAPDAAAVDAARSAPTSPGPPTTLTVTMELSGATTTLISPSELAGLSRTSTTLANILAATELALQRALEDAQAASSDTGMGRIHTLAATPPNIPATTGDLNFSPIVETFVSGELDKSVASGKFADSGYVYSTVTGYGLSSATLDILNKAHVDLTSLLLSAAVVSASASSNVSSAEAKTALLEKLSAMWAALDLGNLPTILLESGLTTGFTELTGDDLASFAANGDLTGTGGNATLDEQKTLTIRTGVYADANGNWTTDSALASALALDEIVFNITNNDYTRHRYLATFTSTAYRSDGTYALTTATSGLLLIAGLTLPASFTNPSITASGSAATSALASAALYIDAVDKWTQAYGTPLSAIIFTPGANLSTMAPLTTAQIAAEYDPANPQTTGGGDGDELIPGGPALIVHTGIYVDANDNWTDDSALATLFGLKELTYSLTRDASAPNDITVEYSIDGGSTYNTGGTVGGATNLQGLGANLVTDGTYGIQTLINPTMGYGKVSIGASNMAMTGPTRAELDTAKALNQIAEVTTNPGTPGQLDATVTIAGVTSPAFQGASPPTLSVTDDMNAIAPAINDAIENLLQLAQNDAARNYQYQGMGRLSMLASVPPDGPSSWEELEDESAVDIYKTAAPANTVTTTGFIDQYKFVTNVANIDTPSFNASGISNFGAWALASAINHNPDSQFWAMVQSHDSNGNSADMVYIFVKKGGDYNSLLACDVADGDIASQEALAAIQFENTANSDHLLESGTSFSLGGEDWAKFKPIQTRAGQGKEVWNLTLNGRDVGKERDLWIAAVSGGRNEVETPGLNADIINGLDRYSFVEIQNADNGPWAGAEVRTQSSAQEALDALNGAMERKDKVRADIGALQNRLENTITNLEIQIESLQNSESRISDVDVATEMTEFVRNQVLAQAAVSMLSQANSLPQMALSLLNG